jgi:hypothetical protein
MLLRTTLLWIHTLSGVTWVGACVCFVLAASTMTAGSPEWRDFTLKATPLVNRIGLASAVLLALTGLVNLYLVGRVRGFDFPASFAAVLGAKTALYCAMVFALAASIRTEAAMRPGAGNPGAAVTEAAGVRRLVRLYGLTAALGAIALALGLWLTGT